MEGQNRQFIPTELGFIVVDLLKEHFANILMWNLPPDGRRIGFGRGRQTDWKKVVRDFYEPFHSDLEKARELAQKIEIKDEEAGKECPKCGRPMLIKHGRFGKFMACSGFPECRHTQSINQELGLKCPLCQGSIVALKSKKGRTFYGCSNYPQCNFRSWDKPTGKTCPQCGDAIVEKFNKKKEATQICQNPDCKQKVEMGG